MMNMLTPLVLGSAVSGGLMVMSFPLVFGSLTSLRYSKTKPMPQTEETVQPAARPPSLELPRQIMSVQKGEDGLFGECYHGLIMNRPCTVSA